MALVLDSSAPGGAVDRRGSPDQEGLLEQESKGDGVWTRQPYLSQTARKTSFIRAKGRDRIFAIASCKGGVGKTWLSVTLSHALAELGQKTLLLDAHFNMAHAALQLDLEVGEGIGAALTKHAPLADVVQNYAHGGFDIVGGCTSEVSDRSAGLEAGRRIAGELTDLAEAYDTVILDTESKLSPAGRCLLNAAGTVIVVVTCELASIASAYDFIRSSIARRPDINLSILVNAADDLNEGYRAYEMLQQACVSMLDVNPVLAGVVRYDENVREAIIKQSAMLDLFPESDAAADVGLIAASLLYRRNGRKSGALHPKPRTETAARPFTTSYSAVAPSFLSDDMLQRALVKIGLPDGLDKILVREIQAMSDVGLTFMTLMSEIEDRATCPAAEAREDDFDPADLQRSISKIRSALKQDQSGDCRAADGVVQFGDWEIDLRRREAVSADGSLAPLTRAEFDVVAALVQEKGRVVSRDYLLDVISRRSLEIGERTVDTLISRIRQKLQPEGRDHNLIVTERGIGYRANLEH